MSNPTDSRTTRQKVRETAFEWPNAQACSHIALISLTISSLITLLARLY